MDSRRFIFALFAANKYMVDFLGKHGKTINQTPLEGLNNAARSYYDYAINKFGQDNPIGAVYYDIDSYLDSIYSNVVCDTPIPASITVYADKYFEGVEIVEDYSTFQSVKEAITAAILHKHSAVCMVKQNDIETAATREFIHRAIVPNAAELVEPLYMWAKNHKQFNLWFAVMIFKHGFISGKRAERAKRRNKSQHQHRRENINQ